MKTRTSIFLLASFMMISWTACTGKTDVTLSDPENTVTDTISFEENRNYLQIGSHTIEYDIQANSFDGKGNIYFAKFGKVDGLAYINHCDEKVWYPRIASVPRYGYMLYMPNQNSKCFARLYVDRFIDSDTLGAIGAVVKYQYPWLIESVSKDSFTLINSKDPTPYDPQSEYDKYWNGSTWYFEGEMSCDGSGIQSFTITFIDVKKKIYSSDLEDNYWLATSLEWEDYKKVASGWQITLRGYDDGGHTSFDFDASTQNEALCEYHHWDIYGNFCLANFIGKRLN